MQVEQINVRIDPNTKIAAEMVFRQLGISATDAIRMFYKQVAMHQGLPFEARIITKQTAKTTSGARIKKFIKKHNQTLSELAQR